MALQQDLDAVGQLSPDYRARALALASTCAVALEWRLPRAALITARGAARSALLALGAAAHGTDRADLALLQKAAVLPSTGRLAGHHNDAEVLAPRVLAVVSRLLTDLPAGADGDAARSPAAPYTASEDVLDKRMRLLP
jgi:hypothetical protein